MEFKLWLGQIIIGSRSGQVTVVRSWVKTQTISAKIAQGEKIGPTMHKVYTICLPMVTVFLLKFHSLCTTPRQGAYALAATSTKHTSLCTDEPQSISAAMMLAQVCVLPIDQQHVW